MTEPRRAKRALESLAGGNEEPWRRRIDRASDATADLEAAAEFLDEVGLDGLRRAIERADRNGDRERLERGRDALEAVRSFRTAARGDHFHTDYCNGFPLDRTPFRDRAVKTYSNPYQSGHGTDLTGEDLSDSER